MYDKFVVVLKIEQICRDPEDDFLLALLIL